MSNIDIKQLNESFKQELILAVASSIVQSEESDICETLLKIAVESGMYVSHEEAISKLFCLVVEAGYITCDEKLTLRFKPK